MKSQSMKPTTVAMILLSASISAFQHHHGPPGHDNSRSSMSSAREYKSSSNLESDERRKIARQIGVQISPNNHNISRSRLSVATLDGLSKSNLPEIRPERTSSRRPRSIAEQFPVMCTPSRQGSLDGVAQASLLVTGNTVGSSMFCLPETVEGVGMAWGSAIFLGLYIINLISGLLLADVAINLHESSECEVPSSFKDFVDATTKDKTAGTLTAGASLLSNSCFLAYGTVAAGPLLVDIFPGLGLNPIVGTGIFASIICFITVTQNNTNLEKIANAIVVVVFSSFAVLLMPSLANVVDPVGAFLTPGTNPDGFSAAASAVPLLLSSLMYQNIVPSISKLLDFNRTKITIAIVVGSFIPMLMYVAWCYADIGGGLDNSIGSSAGAIAFTAFSASALFVSSLTAVMSLAEEYESIFSKTSVKDDDEDGDCPLSNQFSIPAVAASVLPSLVVAILCAEGGDLTGALHFNGAVIIPYLYGVLPIILYNSVRTLQPPTSSFPQRLKD